MNGETFADIKYKRIGCIGTGFVGGSLASNFEKRGFEVISYSLDPKFVNNKEKIKECGLVFICVPTPSTPEGFDDSILLDVINIPAPGTVVVIKSTILPGTAMKLQEKNGQVTILSCPEFLDVSTAQEDTDYPRGNIIGVGDLKDVGIAKEVMKTLPYSPNNFICYHEEAALVKQLHNAFFYMKNVFFNMAYDLCEELGVDYENVRKGVLFDERITPIHTVAVHKEGRGAGGACLIKDFASYKHIYDMMMDDSIGSRMLNLVERKNIHYLKSSGKDIGLLKGVYGDDIELQ